MYLKPRLGGLNRVAVTLNVGSASMEKDPLNEVLIQIAKLESGCWCQKGNSEIAGDEFSFFHNFVLRPVPFLFQKQFRLRKVRKKLGQRRKVKEKVLKFWKGELTSFCDITRNARGLQVDTHGLSKSKERVGQVGQKGEPRWVQRPVSKGLRAGLVKQDQAGEGKKTRTAKKMAGKEQEGNKIQK